MILIEIAFGRKYNPKYVHVAISKCLCDMCYGGISMILYVVFSNEIKHVLIYKRVVTNQIICRTDEAYGLSEV